MKPPHSCHRPGLSAVIAEITIRIPRLSPIVRGVIDRPGFSFGAYMSQQSGGPTEVRSWIAEVFAKFRELELQLLIGELESSLRGGGKGSGKLPGEIISS